MIWIIFLAFIIYYIIGFYIMFYLSENSKIDGPAWIIGYGLGPFVWPLVLIQKKRK